MEAMRQKGHLFSLSPPLEEEEEGGSNELLSGTCGAIFADVSDCGSTVPNRFTTNRPRVQLLLGTVVGGIVEATRNR